MKKMFYSKFQAFSKIVELSTPEHKGLEKDFDKFMQKRQAL